MKRLLLALSVFVVLLVPSGASAATWTPGAGTDSGGASGSCGECVPGGAGGGRTVWFDIANLWQERVDIGTAIQQSTGMSANELRDKFAESYRRSKPENVRAWESRVSQSSYFNGVSWYNTCYADQRADAENFVYDPPGSGRKTLGCRASRTYGPSDNSFPYWGEIHTGQWDGRGPDALMGYVVAWNIQVWREDQSPDRDVPIFQRRIGLNTTSSSPDNDTNYGRSYPELHQQWWRGGRGDAFSSDNRDCAGYGTFLAPEGGIFSGCRRYMGPVGIGVAGDRDRCQDHYQSSPTTFSKILDVYGNAPQPEFRPERGDASGYTYKNNARISPSSGSCYWHFGVERNGPNGTGNQAGEALYFRYTTGPSPSFSYSLQGRPGVFYAIHIVAVDSREQIIPLRASTAYLREHPNNPPDSAPRRDNYFRVYLANPVDTGPPNCEPEPPPPGICPVPPTYCYYNDGTPPLLVSPGGSASDCDDDGDTSSEPKPTVGLRADNPVPTRVEGQATVDVTPAEEITEKQGIFPTVIRLLHFTPQMRYDGARGAQAYTSDYVKYDSFDKTVPTPARWTAPSVPVQAAQMSQPAQLSVKGDRTVISINDFGLSWLRPTLENPCSMLTQASTDGPVSQEGSWPSPGNVCAGGSRNAWDDYLEASTLYEARWVSSDSKTLPIGWIQNQTLRCTSALNGPAVPVSSCNPTNSFEAFRGSAVDVDGNPLGSTQKAQGYVRVVPTDKQTLLRRGGALGVKLNTNRFDLVRGGNPIYDINGNPVTGPVAFHIWDREAADEINPKTGSPWVERVPTVPNNVEPGTAQAWFCTNGIPAGAKLDIGSHGSAADDRTAAQVDAGTGPWKNRVLNDQHGYGEACSGYTAAWRFDQNGESWTTDWTQPWGSCSYNSLPPRSTAYPPPNDASFAGQASAWGRYSEDETWRISSNINLRPLLDGTVPYEGLRPGRPSADGGNTYSRGCYKEFTGRYYQGGWVRDRVEQRQTGTRRVQVGTNPTFGYVSRFNASHTSGPTSRYVGGPRDGEGSGGGHCSAVHPAPLSRNRCVPYYHNYFVWVQTGSTPVYEDQPVYTPYNIYQYRWNGGEANCFPTQPNPENLPALRTVASPGDTTYAPPLPPPPAGERVIEDPNYDPFAPGNWYCNRTVGDGVSYVGQGSWRLGSGPGPGWGKNQTGPSLPGTLNNPDSGQYIVEWTFSGMSQADQGSTTWQLRASYDGHTRWNWLSRTRSSQIIDNPEAGKVVAAYGTRTTR